MPFRVILLFFPTVILFINGYSQYGPKSFGDVSIQEMAQKNFPLDTSATAIVLFNKGEIILDPYSTTGTAYRRHMRIKLLKKESFDQWGNQKHFFEGKGSTVSKVEAATYNLVNGKIERRDLEQSMILKKKGDKFSNEINFVFPELTEGSIVEFSFQHNLENLYLATWWFQLSIPVYHSEFSFHSPIKDVIGQVRGDLKLSSHESKFQNRYQRWVMTNIPAFVREPLMPSPEIYYSALYLYTSRDSWKDIHNEFKTSSLFAGIVYGNKELILPVLEARHGLTDTLQVIEAIVNYVKQKVAWDGTFDYLGTDPKELLAKKKGSSGDINLLLGSLLDKAGFKVAMVLTSTAENGYINRDYPSKSQFDYVLCHVVVNNKSLFLDATDKYLPYNRIPFNCHTYLGFVVLDYGFEWIRVNSPYWHKTVVGAELELRQDGTCAGKVTFSIDGYEAAAMRKKLEKNNPDQILKDRLKNSVWHVSRSELLDKDDLTKSVKEVFEVTSSSHAVVNGDLIYLDPYFFLKEESNPFQVKKRVYPIDLGRLWDRVMSCSITIPENYEVEDLPENKVISLPEDKARCHFSFSRTGNKLYVVSRIVLNSALFYPDEYEALREFFNRLVAKQREQIVLRKKI